MDTGDWIALVAVVISVAAAIVSVHQAKTAKSSADSAEEANRLTREQMDREAAKDRQAQAEAEAAALREAEAVSIDVGGNGGSVRVRVTNNGSQPVTHMELVDVQPGEPGPWRSWAPNANVSGLLRETKRPHVPPHQALDVAVWLLDENGQQIIQMPTLVDVKVRFRDADGQWWLTSRSAGPERIDDPAI